MRRLVEAPPWGIAVGNAATQRRGYIRTLNDLGAKFCDATPHGFATFPFTHRIGFW